MKKYEIVFSECKNGLATYSLEIEKLSLNRSDKEK